MNNKIIILGSTGFIGSSLCMELKSQNIKFLGLSSKDVDLLSQEQTDEVLSSVDKNDSVVFMSTIIPSKDEEGYKNNMLMLKNFTNTMKKKINHLIYISSDAVYNDSSNKITEMSDKNTSNLYSKMHLDREKLIKRIFKQKSN